MKKKFISLLCILQLIVLAKSMAQNVSINTTGNTADASAMLDITASDKGLLIPRMTQAQRLAIATPADALLVYQTDGSKGFYFYNSATSAWTLLASSGGSISSLNGLTVTSQTFATPTTTGTVFGFNSAGSVHTLNIPMASAATVTAGLLSNTDWNNFNNKASSTNTWLLTGNTTAAIATNFLGTTDATSSLRFRTNNTQRFLIDSAGNVAVGNAPTQTAGVNMEKLLVDAGSTAANPTTSINVITGRGYINSYLQLNIQNKNGGTSASSDVVATADNGDETTNYVDMGINSSGNTANYFGALNDAYLYNLGQNLLIGTGTANKSLIFMTGGGTQSTNERMRIDGSGKVGIGTTAPATALHVYGVNPLTLTGVSTGTSTTADSLLTITNGLVRKLPISTFATSANSWSTTGNGGSSWATNFLGTTDNNSIRFKTNNITGLMLDSLGSVSVGATPAFTTGLYREKFLIDAGVTTSYNPIVVQGSIDSFFQFNIQNLSAGIHASSDIVATSNNGTEVTNYIDMGINSATNTSNFYGTANGAYLYNVGQDLLIGTSTPNKSLHFLTGGGDTATSERMRIDGAGRVGIGTATPNVPLHVVSTTAAATSGTASDVATFETTTPLATDRSFPPQVNFVRQINSTFYASGNNPIGPILNFGLKTSGTKYDFAQITTETLNANSKIGFWTKTGMTNGNPSGGTMAEAMILDGGNLGIGTTTPASTLDLNGSISQSIVTAPGAITLTAAHYTVILTAATATVVTLPAASTCSGRVYVLVNRNVAKTTNISYQAFSGTANTIAQYASMTLQSDGTNWYRIQ